MSATSYARLNGVLCQTSIYKTFLYTPLGPTLSRGNQKQYIQYRIQNDILNTMFPPKIVKYIYLLHICDIKKCDISMETVR